MIKVIHSIESSIGKGKCRADASHRVGKEAPTAQDWEALQERIKKLYIDKGMTCEDLAVHMASTYGFHATKRMYKTKFQAWDFPTKKKKREDYLAMQAVAQHFQRQGEEVCFVVVKGNKQIIRTAEQINKELHRPGDKTPMDFDKALQILHRNKIRRISKPRADAARQRRRSDQTPALPDLQDLMQLEQIAPTIEPISPFTNPSDPLCTDNGSSVQSPPLLPVPQLQNAIEPDMYDSLDLFLPLHQLETLPDIDPAEWEDFLSEPMASDFNLPVLGSADDSFFFDAVFTTLEDVEMTADVDLLTGSTSAQEKFSLVEWAATELLENDNESEGSDTTSSDLALCKRRGVNIFKQFIMSEEVSDFLLPGLCWMMNVTGNTWNDEQLKEFLKDCRAAIIETGRQSPFFDVFHYVCAIYSGKRKDKTKYGSRIVTHFDPSSSSLDWRNPNVIVGQIYRAWHLLHIKERQAAIDGLQAARFAIEETMDTTDLIEASCLAILARAYSEDQQWTLARETLQTAINQFQLPGEHLHVFLAELKDRLAGYLCQCEKYVEAEPLLREVVDTRRRIGGWMGPELWYSINELWNMLSSVCRFDEADSFLDECVEEFEDDSWI